MLVSELERHMTGEPVTDPVRAGTAVLGAEGPVARFLPGYEPRQPQIDMANLCDELIEAGGHGLIEAGTGTGKSLAYLIPAIRSGKKVVVSTDTLQLQEQIIGKDLPFLEQALGVPVSYAIAKGRANYFCERNARAYVQESALIDPVGVDDANEALRQFVREEWDGDKASLRVAIQEMAWQDISGDDSCTGKSCPHASRCPVLAARRRVADADLIITNHTMYLLHHYLLWRTHSVTLLPDHTVWIADEAHTLSDKAVDVWGVEIGQNRPANYVRRLLKQAKRLDLEAQLERGDLDLRAIENASRGLFSLFTGALKDQQLLEEFPEEVLTEARERVKVLVVTLKPVRMLLHRAAVGLNPEYEEDRDKLRAIKSLRDAADGLIDALEDMFEPPTVRCPLCEGSAYEADEVTPCARCEAVGRIPDPDPPVVYVEVARGRSGEKQVTLHSKPAETRRIFHTVLKTLDTALFTSATLSTGPGAAGFRPIAADLGINLVSAETLQVESPFDYARQVRGYLPTTIPKADSPMYHSALAAEVVRILSHTQGRAFILFTSNRDMRLVYDLVMPKVRFQVLMQGDMPKDMLVEEFKNTPNAVLFGVKTFWTGVDIVGDALSCVVLVKLPFPQYDHPLNKARSARIEARGGNSFGDFMLPRCIRDVLQGFGRLIRSRRDTGLFVILDPRMHSARYGRTIAMALPNFPCGDQL